MPDLKQYLQITNEYYNCIDIIKRYENKTTPPTRINNNSKPFFYVFRTIQIKDISCFNIKEYIKKFKQNKCENYIDNIHLISTSHSVDFNFSKWWEPTSILLIIKIKIDEKYFLLHIQSQSEITLPPCRLYIKDIKKFKVNPGDDNFRIAFICDYKSYDRDEAISLIIKKNSEIILDGGYKNKYLKYKQKYLTLKNNLNKF